MDNSTTATGHAIEEHWIDVDGTATRYLAVGEGPPVLLLHGEGGVAEEWNRVMRGLADRYRAIAVDLPGYGYTGPIPDTTASATASFVWRFARAVRVERPVIVGHSLGGAVAVHAALQRPHHTKALVLVSSSGMGRAVNPALALQSVWPLGELTQLIRFIPGGPQLLVAAAVAAGCCRPWRVSPAWWSSEVKAASTPVALSTTLRSQRSAVGLLGQKNLVIDRLPELRMPTLVVWGIQDRILPAWQAVAVRRKLGHGQLRLIPFGGHLLAQEAADRFLDAMRPFLAEAGHDATDEKSGQ